MTDKEKLISKINKNIDNIEQLGADARFYYNKDQYDRLKVQIESIQRYADTLLKDLNKLKELGE